MQKAEKISCLFYSWFKGGGVWQGINLSSFYLLQLNWKSVSKFCSFLNWVGVGNGRVEKSEYILTCDLSKTCMKPSLDSNEAAFLARTSCSPFLSPHVFTSFVSRTPPFFLSLFNSFGRPQSYQQISVFLSHFTSWTCFHFNFCFGSLLIGGVS